MQSGGLFHRVLVHADPSVNGDYIVHLTMIRYWIYAVMPLDVLGRTVRTVFPLPSLPFLIPKELSLTFLLARYTDRDNEYITLAGRFG